MKINLTNREKLDFSSNLSTLIGAGVPIVEALESMLNDSKGNLKKFLNKINDDIQGGKSLSFSIEEIEKAFGSVSISLIKVGEESGNLDEALRDLADSLEKEIGFNEKVRSALSYPVLVFMVFMTIMIVMLVYVIPRISDVFSRLNVEIPLATRILIFISNLILVNTTEFLIGGFVLAVAITLLSIFKKSAIVLFLSSLPLIKPLIVDIDIARFSHNMGVLLRSGVPAVKALRLSSSVTFRPKLKKAIEDSADEVESGKSISQSLGKTRAFPNRVITILGAGEKSGNLDKSLNEISRAYELSTEASLKRITIMLEPILLAVIGLIVGGIMLSIIAPIYQLIGSINPR